MSAGVSVLIAFVAAFAAALLVILLAVFPFRKEIFHCIGKRYMRKKPHILGHEMSEF
jgi:xanthine/uracil/vitamin C permease (AzgA family)